MSSSLKGEIEPEEHTATPDVAPIDLRSFGGFYDGVFGVPGQPRPAKHEWIPAGAEGIRIKIAEVGRIRGKRLAGHTNELIPLNKDELWIVGVVGLNKAAVPAWGPGASWKRHISWRARTEKSVFPAMQIEETEIYRTC